MHNSKTVLHNIIYAYYIKHHELNLSRQSSLDVDHRLRQTTVDTDILQYLLEEFCCSAKATQH